MEFQRDRFSSYEKSGGTVVMGNDVACKIVGTRYVRVCFHDRVMRTITQVARDC